MNSEDSLEKRAAARHQRSLYLLIASGGLLLLPLAGLAYLYFKGAHLGVLSAASTFRLFEKQVGAPAARRPGMAAPAIERQNSLTAPALPAPNARPLGGSLDFIRGGEDYREEQAQAAPAGPAAQAQAPAKAPAAPPKAFRGPKLQAPGINATFSGRESKSEKPADGKGSAEAPPDMPDVNELMKNLPQQPPQGQ